MCPTSAAFNANYSESSVQSSWVSVVMHACEGTKVQKTGDDMFTFLWHLRPFRFGEFILAHPDSPLHPRRDGLTGVGVKWREPTQPAHAAVWWGIGSHCIDVTHTSFEPIIRQDASNKLQYLQDVHDDTQRPHVARLVIFLRSQDLRSLTIFHKKIFYETVKMNQQLCKYYENSPSIHAHFPSANVSGQKKQLTNVVGCVTGRLQRVVQGCLLGEAKVCQFEDCVFLFGGVQQVLWLRRDTGEEKERVYISRSKSSSLICD